MRKALSRAWFFATSWTIQSMEISRPEYWSRSLSLLQGIFPTQKLNPGMQVRKQQLELDMEQQTGSKSGKEYVKAIFVILLI